MLFPLKTSTVDCWCVERVGTWLSCSIYSVFLIFMGRGRVANSARQKRDPYIERSKTFKHINSAIKKKNLGSKIKQNVVIVDRYDAQSIQLDKSSRNRALKMFTLLASLSKKEIRIAQCVFRILDPDQALISLTCGTTAWSCTYDNLYEVWVLARPTY